MTIQKKIASRILEIREQKGITQLTVANAVKMSRTQYAHYELGNKNISVQNLKRICEGLKISVSEFFNHELFTIK